MVARLRNIRRGGATLLLSLAFAAFAYSWFQGADFRASGRDAVVVRVIDGDTFVIRGGERVRLIGIDTPEKGKPGAAQATARTKRLVLGKRVRLEKDVSERDRYGRLLRYVYVGRVFVNAELVRSGYARMATFPPDVRHAEDFLRLQREAQRAGRGMWGFYRP